MGITDSPYNTYSDDATRKVAITDVISLITPHDAPFIEAIGGLDGAASKFRFVNWPSTKCEWLEDTLEPLTDTLMTATIASDATSATIADASKFEPGHIVQIDLQFFYVSAVNTTTNVLTMASLGGTAASHASAAVIYKVSMARLEGAESTPIAMTTRTKGTNYTQIFHQEVKVSRTQAQQSQWGIDDEYEYQANKAIPNLMRLIEQHILLYPGAASAGSATEARIMAGITNLMGTGNATSGASLTKAKFDAAVLLAFEDGGDGPWIAPCAPTNFQKIGGFYETSAYLRIERKETTVGMPPVETIQTPYGQVNLVMDRWEAAGNIPLVDVKHVGMRTFYPFTREELAKTGDATKGEVIGEFTLCLRQAGAHAVLTSVT